MLVCSAQWKSRQLKDIISNERIIDFNATDQITLDYLKKYDVFCYAQRGRYFINQTENLAAMVSEGMGYTVLTKEFAQSYVRSKQLIILNKAQTLDVHHVLAWFDRPQPPPYVTALIDAIN